MPGPNASAILPSLTNTASCDSRTVSDAPYWISMSRIGKRHARIPSCVAAPCEEIARDPNNAFKYTSRGNLVAVITNGTAVLGLGDIGPLAAKPVMEGKGVLFKKFAGIDVFDIEVNEKHDLDKLVDVIAALEPTFGG